MALNKQQVYIYEVTTFAMFSKEENDLYNQFKNTSNRNDKNVFRQKLDSLIRSNTKQRVLRDGALNERNLISLFESDLTRWITKNVPAYVVSDKTANGKDLIRLNGILTLKIKHYDILKQIINKGVLVNGKKYVFYTASAGQIRHNKITLVEENIKNQYEPTVMCGLSVEKINKNKGVNNSKYLAYKALPLSSSLPVNIDIDKTIVVPDMELLVDKDVEYIDNQTFESKIINIKDTGDLVDMTDGCGMICPQLNKEIKEQLNINYPLTGLQIRAPWIKGALFPFDFIKFCKNINGGNYIVRDTDGKDHDVLKENIEIIFTESQFKMHSQYESWNDYKKYFKESGATFNVTAVNNNYIDRTQMSYQFLQTLDRNKVHSHVDDICKSTVNYIKSLHTDLDEIYKVFGVDKEKTCKTPLQEALLVYPELLNDVWVKDQIKKKIKSVRKYALAAKLKFPGFYGYMMPDLYAFCEWLFCMQESNGIPQGIIPNDYIYCNYFKDSDVTKCDCLRSPHLYNEHTVRKLSHDEKCKEWFQYCGQNIIYSVHDLVPLSVQGDVDGDQLSIIPLTNETKAYFECIEPHYILYYRMFKAPAQLITNNNIYHTLVLGYSNNEQGHSIGDISNSISKLWNSDKFNYDKLKMIKMLTMYNNFTIDYAKTNSNIELPKEVENDYAILLKSPTPYFFRWAKGKKKTACADINDSVINTINAYVEQNTKGLKFNITTGTKFDYSILQNRKDNMIYPAVVKDKKYLKLQQKLRQWNYKIKQINQLNKKYRNNVDFDITYSMCYKDLMGLYTHGNAIDPKEKLVNSIVDIIYAQREKIGNSNNILWNCFGDVVVRNIIENTKNKFYKPITKVKIPISDQEEKEYTEIESKIDQMIENGQVKFYQGDVDLIKQIENERYRKVLFVIITLCKLFNSNKIYVSDHKNSKLTKYRMYLMCNVHSDTFNKAIRYLIDNWYIKTINEKGKTVIQLLPKFNNKSEKIKFLVPNINRAYVYYEYNFNHKSMEQCIICGRDFIKNSNVQKTCCSKCSDILRKQNWHKIYKNR